MGSYMNKIEDKNKYMSMLMISILGGVIVNSGFGFISYIFGLPLYLDTIGTIGVASVAGVLPALIVAVCTNIVCGFFNQTAIYYSLISILIAIIAGSWLPRKKKERPVPAVVTIIVIALISGVLGSGIQLILFGAPQLRIVTYFSNYLTLNFIPKFEINFFIVHVLINLIDKGLCTFVGIGIVSLLPDDNCTGIANLCWKQTPINIQQLKATEKDDPKSGNLQRRITILIFSAALAITFLLVWISLSIFSNFAINLGNVTREENILLTQQYLVRVVLIFSGYFIFILYTGSWIAKYYLVYPMHAIADCTSNFMVNDNNENLLKENVDKLKSIDIQTKDELEYLYNAICKMADDSYSQMNDLKYQSKAISQMQTGLIVTMADMVENRDKDTGYHIQKTADYVRIIVEGLKAKGYYADKITPKYISDVVLSAPLHDIGKINIPDAILNKPGKLTDEEFTIMKTHAEDGRKIIERAITVVQGENYLKEARNMAGYHHEKWDGTGYPEGLKGQVIPLSARIMAVADVFDALSSKRVYKDAMPFEDALAILQKDASTHFDPKCVEVFIDAKDEVRKVMEKYKD